MVGSDSQSVYQTELPASLDDSELFPSQKVEVSTAAFADSCKLMISTSDETFSSGDSRSPTLGLSELQERWTRAAQYRLPAPIAIKVILGMKVV